VAVVATREFIGVLLGDKDEGDNKERKQIHCALQPQGTPGRQRPGALERDDDEIDADPCRHDESQDSDKGGPADDRRNLVHHALLNAGSAAVLRMQFRD